MHKLSDWLVKSYSALINPDVEILNRYTGAKSRMECRCRKCGKEFFTTHYRLLNIDRKYSPLPTRRNRLCPSAVCASSASPNKRIADNTLDIVFSIQNNAKGKYNLLNHFVSMDCPIRCECLQCGHVWESMPAELIRVKTKCPSCKNADSADWKYKKLAEKYEGKFDIEFHNAIEFKCHCKKCNSDFLINIGKDKIVCPKCRTKGRNSHKEELFAKGLTSVHKSVDDIDTGVQHDIITGTLTEYDIDAILYYSRDEFINMVSRITPNIIILDQNIDSAKKVKCQCKTCNSVWSTRVHYLTRGAPCPKCRGSAGERAIVTYLDDNGINYIRECSFNNCRDKLPLRFDFYLPDANAVIEFDGLQHFMPVAFIRMDNHDEVVEQFRELQKRDDIKNKYCRRKGIHMLRIKYDEKDIVGIIEDFLNKIGG